MIYSIDQSFNQIYLLSLKCIHLHVAASTSFHQDSSHTPEPMESFFDLRTTASAVSSRQLEISRHDRTKATEFLRYFFVP
jgi:hypothetical protein